MSSDVLSVSSKFENNNKLSRLHKCLGNFSFFLYNKETKQFLGRTGLSWLQIISFYIWFYAFLGLLLMALISAFLALTWWKYPYLTGELNLLRLTPGIQVLPVTDNTTLILKFSSIKNSLSTKYITATEKLFDDIRLIDKKAKVASCNISNDSKLPNSIDYICPFNVSDFGPCEQPNLLISRGEICLFLTINNIYGWLPNILNEKIPGPTLTCTGSFTADNENIFSISYYPNRNGKGYFSNIYFPYIRQVGYKRPYVAIHLTIQKCAVVFIDCIFSNIQRNHYAKFGILKSHFEVIIDGPPD